ncbi:MAG: hypothetical protein ISR53_06370 [Rhodospirillales bacterium]|nr:hypothetical protein [Rhodospirillales bacterium]
MSTKTGEDILLQAEKVSSLIAAARHLMGEGKTVDLSNLEGKISSLCKSAQSAQLDNPDTVRTALQSIVKDLNQLDEEITSRHEKAGGQSLEASIKRAINAYGLDNEES